MSRRARSLKLQRIGWTCLFLLSAAFWLPLLIIKSSTDLKTLDAIESALIVTVKIATAMFFVAVGASIGSFVNVLAYRMPIGKSVIFNPSACPRCKGKIKLRHNIPVFGWLMLGGRCYVCKLPISKRYPLVEAWFGFFFLVLFYVELATGTFNIPETRDYYVRTISAIVWGLDKEALGLFSFHCLMLCTLSTWSLFKLDRQSIPRLAILVPLLAGLVAVCLWSFLHPVAWFRGTGIEQIESGIGLALMNSACGFVDGMLIGLMFEWICRSNGVNQFPQKGLMWGMGLVGLFLGWQALYSAIAIFGVAYLVTRIGLIWLAAKPVPLMFVWTVSVLLQLCLWRILSQFQIWPGVTNTDVSILLINVVVSIGSAIILVVMTNSLLPLTVTTDEQSSAGN